MKAPHICLACRRRLGQARIRSSLWQPRATFISLSSGKARITTDDPPIQEDSNSKHNYEIQSGTRNNNASRRRGARPPGRTADKLEFLFECSLKQSNAAASGRTTSSIEPYRHAETLKKMMAESYPLADSWAFFVDHFGPNPEKVLSKNTNSLPSYLHTTSKALLSQIVNMKRSNLSIKSLPAFSELSRVHLQMGTLKASEWTEMIYILLENISLVKSVTSHVTSQDHQLILDLLHTWNVGIWRDVEPEIAALPACALDWSHLPHITTLEAQHIYTKKGPHAMFWLVVPSLPGRCSNLPLLGLATYNLLTSNSLASHPQITGSQPLISCLGTLASVKGLTLGQLNPSSKMNTVECYVKDNWHVLRERASRTATFDMDATEVSGAKSSQRMKADTEGHGLDRHINAINKRLHVALSQKNVNQVEALWSDVLTWPPRSSQSAQRAEGTLTLELCNHFVLVYVGLRHPNRAIDVWNHMVVNGLTPTVATWDAMLSGCKSCGDWHSLEEIWKKLTQSEIEPDVVCWTTRISGLMASKQFELGLNALDEMGRLWLAAAQNCYPGFKLSELQLKKDVKGAAKPSIATVNGAIASLMRHGKRQIAQQILTWANTFGIKPDVITYNIYLRPLIRNGQTTEAIALLQQMHGAGIKPDVATFVTILDEAFRNSTASNPQGQREVVNSIFTEMEQADVEASSHIYGRIIFQLLRNSDANISTVNYVLERMAKQGLQPSLHIYTTLMEYHFNQEPPNLDAARNIIDRATAVVGVDRIFWDKAVENYARLGETGAALRILGRLATEKTRVGWVPLRELLQALAKNQEWDLARSVVRDALGDGDSSLPDAKTGTLSQNNFWQVAQDLGLLEHNK